MSFTADQTSQILELIREGLADDVTGEQRARAAKACQGLANILGGLPASSSSSTAKAAPSSSAPASAGWVDKLSWLVSPAGATALEALITTAQARTTGKDSTVSATVAPSSTAGALDIPFVTPPQ